jgi:hypothetical protein
MSISARTRQSTWSTDAPEAPVARNLGICLIGGLPIAFIVGPLAFAARSRPAARAISSARQSSASPRRNSRSAASKSQSSAAPLARSSAVRRFRYLGLIQDVRGNRSRQHKFGGLRHRSSAKRDCRATGETTFAPIYAPFCSQSTRTLAPCSERLASCVSTGEAACCRNRSWLRRLQNDVV